MKVKKLLEKIKVRWQSKTKSDKAYTIAVSCVIVSCIIAMFISLAIYGWSITDLLKDNRTEYLVYIATIALTCVMFVLYSKALTSGTTKKHKKTLITIGIFTALCYILSVVLILVNYVL